MAKANTINIVGPPAKAGGNLMEGIQWKEFNGRNSMEGIQWSEFNGGNSMEGIQWRQFNGGKSMEGNLMEGI